MIANRVDPILLLFPAHFLDLGSDPPDVAARVLDPPVPCAGMFHRRDLHDRDPARLDGMGMERVRGGIYATGGFFVRLEEPEPTPN